MDGHADHLYTGHGDVPITVQAMKAGAVEFLTKPFTDTVLLDESAPIFPSVVRQSLNPVR